MTNFYSGISLLSGITSGLTNTYSLLASQYPNGLTLENITSARGNTSLTTMLNQNFAAYMQTNFSSLDKNKDGKIDATEMTNFTNNLSAQGFTQAQLTQLGTATGMSTNALEQVLAHFNEIDTNHDGKVTNAEISAFSILSNEEKKKTEFSNQFASNMSVFYGDDDSSSASASSMVDFMYMNTNANSTSSTSSSST